MEIPSQRLVTALGTASCFLREPWSLNEWGARHHKAHNERESQNSQQMYRRHNSQPEKTGNSERFYEDKVREVTHYGKGSKKRNRQISFKGK